MKHRIKGPVTLTIEVEELDGGEKFLHRERHTSHERAQVAIGTARAMLERYGSRITAWHIERIEAIGDGTISEGMGSTPVPHKFWRRDGRWVCDQDGREDCPLAISRVQDYLKPLTI